MIVWSPAQYESKPNSSARLATMAGSALLCGVTCINPIFIAHSLFDLADTTRPVVGIRRASAFPPRQADWGPNPSGSFHDLAQAAGGGGNPGVLHVSGGFVVDVHWSALHRGRSVRALEVEHWAGK